MRVLPWIFIEATSNILETELLFNHDRIMAPDFEGLGSKTSRMSLVMCKTLTQEWEELHMLRLYIPTGCVSNTTIWSK